LPVPGNLVVFGNAVGFAKLKAEMEQLKRRYCHPMPVAQETGKTIAQGMQMFSADLW
jgi:hypothetical protein